ncbi:ATP-binding protein [Flavobacterium sp. MFBS3-15]|uniref:ATP-binding response regulator n=1 Tax=Flavobacterium sp. MFBS3-15 TaxID=2989816 RepID=UPI0022367D67|nr:ATP-binding protein [Flavobacterium sp. MFBS3-15]MCW4468329.1 ATP-binding protein [Flavobacterium sp. MFBS3-15]
MVQKPKAVKYKVIAGYVLLFAVAVLSVWFLYMEIVRIAIPEQAGNDNKNIVRISNTIADLYASEAMGRSAILSGKAEDYSRYIQTIDSISSEIETVKSSVEPAQVPKFDSIRMLLARKKQSITDIRIYRNKYGKRDPLNIAIDGIYSAKDSVWDQTKPVRSRKQYEARQLVYSALPQKMLDSLSKLQVSNDSLAIIFDKVLSNVIDRSRKVNSGLIEREQRLLDENRIISDQLRTILTSVEKDFLEKSYAKIDESKSAVAATIRKVAWIGAITLFFLIVFAWFIIRDLTSNQNYRKQLEALNLENEDLLRTKTMLMATVTHDLQTPLGSIIGFHDLIKDSGISSKQGQYLSNIKQSADYILKLVNDLLDFSRLENNRINIEESPFNVKSLVESTCMALEPMANKKNIELNWDVDDMLDDNFISDSYRIKQVLTNLVSNAIKFTSHGSVEVIAKAYGFEIQISVLDTGIGIAPEKHADVFKEFTQAHEGIEKKFGGTGLGLTISQKIIELLDGTIHLESEEGRGSIFTISIPRIAGKGDAATAKISELVQVSPALKHKNILVVDDDTTQLALMSELLRMHVGKIQTLNNSAEVINMIEEGNSDLIITDLQMPNMDGFEVLQAIRNHSDTMIASLPVIVLSGRKDLSASDFLDRGFSAYHSKPVNFKELLKLIEVLLSGKPVSVMEAKEQADLSLRLYNLESLKKFTNNDPVSLRNIVMTFIDSAKTNCHELVESAGARDARWLAETAHRMIPMLRQMEVHSIAGLLVPLEDGTATHSWDELEIYIGDICNKMQALCLALEQETA